MKLPKRERTFAINTTDRSISRLQEELKAKSQENGPVKQWAMDLNREFPREEIRIAKRCLVQTLSIESNQGR